MKDLKINIKELSKEKVYIFEVDVSNLPRKDQINSVLQNIKNTVEAEGIKGLFVPRHKTLGVGVVPTEIHDYVKSHKEEFIKDLTELEGEQEEVK